MKEIKAYIRCQKAEIVLEALEQIGIAGITLIDVMGVGQLADPKTAKYSIKCVEKYSKKSCSFHGPESAYGNIKIPYQSGIEVGDRVTFETQETAQNISALIIFGLPILLILAGYFVVTQYFSIPHAELWGVLSGIAVYALLLIGFNKWFSRLPMFLPKIIKVEKVEIPELDSKNKNRRKQS